ncbi:hypothetical protein K493DRAFT_320284 [Basidiobolus meristosporus CBS 931.73]|uniref:Uncharacterized protein n=1 Tax=Basidiobolus meristosporus CBS 931.73 TaxID=1314790 RepID=A0A1Y1XC00_9FUNG|nr:hypothetical protein K493DRAFT_320284 [Basidiobolus meristosporus CBS 931.73]|eukprot:ORX83247.1 hypothetical protein K493DRAFT_320284 [Basidiobolus meristosporus CBS 931.73]
MVFFYVNDVFLYFDIINRTRSCLRALIVHNGGPGYILEEAIKLKHRLFIKWLLLTVYLPKDYVLASAACFGDLFTLQYIVSLLGPKYKAYDTPAKLICILKAKLPLLEYLYQRNPSFRDAPINVGNCVIAGIRNSSKMCSWYLHNTHICPKINRAILVQGFLADDDLSGAIGFINDCHVGVLSKALADIPSVKEETLRWLIFTYSEETRLLGYIAKACSRLGYVDTLEILFNEPYNVHVVLDYFGQPYNLAVTQVLHKYGCVRNRIYNTLNFSGFGAYRSLCSHRTVFLHYLCRMTRRAYMHSRFLREEAENSFLFLAELAEVASANWLLEKCIIAAIECGFLRSLKMLLPCVRGSNMQRLTQRIAHSRALRCSTLEIVEYLGEFGIVQSISKYPLLAWCDLRQIRDLTGKGLLSMRRGWDPELEDVIRKSMIKLALRSSKFFYTRTRESLLEMIHPAYGERCTFEGFDDVVSSTKLVTFSTKYPLLRRTSVILKDAHDCLKEFNFELERMGTLLLLMECSNRLRVPRT